MCKKSPIFGTELVLTVVRHVIQAPLEPEEAHAEHSLSGGADGMAMGQATKLTLRIEADGADAEELDVMTGQLLAEVRAGWTWTSPSSGLPRSSWTI